MENDLVIYGDLMFDELLDLSNEEEMQMVSSETLVPSSWQKDAINSHPSPLADATATHTTPTPASNSSPHDATDFICDFDLDMAEMEWLSNFVEESFSPTAVEVHHPKVGGKSTTGDKPPNHQNDCVHAVHVEDELLYLTDSPLSVLENSMGILVSSALSPSSSVSSRTTSSTSCSGSTGIITKRPRPDDDDTSPLSGIGVEATLLVTTPDHDQVDGGSSAGNYNNNENMKKSKKLKIKLSTPQQVGAGVADARKCLHCGMQKTPQWRAGPMGPKTLCNACGVRYKTGRLFPEYRPAASPTFVASVHSNSHKKVVEMRMKGDEEGGKKQVASKCCDLLNYIKGSNDWGFHEGRKEAKRSSRSLQQPATSDDSFPLS